MGHFDRIVPSLASILTKQQGVHGGKYVLKISGNAISETLNFKMSLDASALKNLYGLPLVRVPKLPTIYQHLLIVVSYQH